MKNCKKLFVIGKTPQTKNSLAGALSVDNNVIEKRAELCSALWDNRKELFAEIALQQTGQCLAVAGFVTEMLNFRRFFKHIIVLAQTKAQIAKTL